VRILAGLSIFFDKQFSDPCGIKAFSTEKVAQGSRFFRKKRENFTPRGVKF
jgi:hypothetical protein